MPLDNNPNYTIQAMDPANPADTDLLTEADNQLREIKSVLTDNFPLFDDVLLFKPKEANDLELFIGGSTDLVLKMSTLTYVPAPNKQTRLLYISADGTTSSGLPLVPIGSYYYSLIPPARMTLIYPGMFAQPNGDPIDATTKYAQITGRVTLPNVFALTKSCFLRPITGAFALSSTNPFKTAKNGLSLIINATIQDHDHGGGSHTHQYNDNRGIKGCSTGEGRQYHNNTLVQKTTGPVALVNTATPLISSYSHGHTVTISDGGNETAPKHLLMYLYLRIN